MKTYTGERTLDGIRVCVDEQSLDPRYDIKVFSDGDYEWAYEGDEPRQLALAILADHTGDSSRALEYCEPFMREIVANLDNDWELTSDDIEESLAALDPEPQPVGTAGD
ncbi:MAG: DUF6166 domain-containing protein [Halofilum sp. (in: g-proteobacteria)]|nr:DUF6166 domain-containing protein [Halofilum sp. (in: g-proteobacteria)]